MRWRERPRVDERDEARPSVFALDLARLGGAPIEGAAPDRLARLERVEARFRDEVLPATVDAVVRELAAPPATPWWRVGWRPAMVAGAVAAVVFAVVLAGRFPAEPGIPGVRMKGSVGMQVFGHRDDRTFRVREGERLRPGDRLKLRLDAPGEGWAAVYSVEAGGRVTPFYPPAGSEPIRVGPEPWLSPASIVLDDSVGPERLVVIFAARPFDVAVEGIALREAARVAGGVQAPLRLPAGFDQATLLFEKSGGAP
jgi:hypothetical protein